MSTTSEQLIPGDRVRVYQKPYTSEDYEGPATLVDRFRGRPHDPERHNLWFVRFDDENEEYLRLVLPRHKMDGTP